MSKSWVKLLDICRSGVTERTIFGAVALAHGDHAFAVDGFHPQIFGRSLMKPFQMKAVALELGSLLSSEEKALALASHNGTAQQVQVAQQILKPEEWKLLKLPESLPMGGGSIDKSIWFNPCAGKHAAILRACQVARWPTENYWEVDHPYNARLVAAIENVIGKDALCDRTVAPDGCRLPTYALATTELAKLFQNLAQTRDQDWIWTAYHDHPQLIGGKNRLDTSLLECFPNILAKEGADGLLGLAIVDSRFPQGLGVVIKLAHGYDMPILWHLAGRILRDLGYEAPAPPAFVGQTLNYSPALAKIYSSIPAAPSNQSFD